MRLSQTNQRPLPRSPVSMACATCERSPKIAEFFPTGPIRLVVPQVVTTRLPRRGGGGFMLRRAVRSNARDQTSSRHGSTLLCSGKNFKVRQAGKMKAEINEVSGVPLLPGPGRRRGGPPPPTTHIEHVCALHWDWRVFQHIQPVSNQLREGYNVSFIFFIGNQNAL